VCWEQPLEVLLRPCRHVCAVPAVRPPDAAVPSVQRGDSEHGAGVCVAPGGYLAWAREHG
jgi:hypothetical protein